MPSLEQSGPGPQVMPNSLNSAVCTMGLSRQRGRCLPGQDFKDLRYSIEVWSFAMRVSWEELVP